MTVPLILGRDGSGAVDFRLPVTTSGQKYRVNLTAGVAQSLTIPPLMTSAFFSFSNGVDVHVDFATTASVPGSSFAPTTAELNPGQRYGLLPGNSLSFISDTTAYVYVTFFPQKQGGI